MGADMLFMYPPQNANASNDLYNKYYPLIYSAAQNGGLAWFGDNLTPYRSLSAEQQRQIAIAAQQIFDGECENFEVRAGICATENATPPNLLNGMDNVNLGALTLLSTQQALTTPDVNGYVFIDQENWNKLSSEDQWKIMVITYKEGYIAIGHAIQQAKDANDGQIENWEQIATQINNVDADCQPDAGQPADCGLYYVEQIMCYGNNVPNGGTPCGSK